MNDRKYRGDLFFREWSPGGNPWIESLWVRMKVESESLIHQTQTLEELQQMIDERFEYYNRGRRHSSIGHRRPGKYAKEKRKPGENIDLEFQPKLALKAAQQGGQGHPHTVKVAF